MLLKERGSRIFWCSDELYLKAGRELPPDEYYEEYSQPRKRRRPHAPAGDGVHGRLDFTEPDEARARRHPLRHVAAAPL